MIPNLKPLIEPLTTRFPAAWAKAKAPHDDGEFNARVCAVLHYEQGMTEVGRNGKRGDPKNLSRDVINWKGTADEPGPNPDPTGQAPHGGTIIDFIANHESSSAHIWQGYPDPSGPGAWVKPLTLAQIDNGGETPTPQPPQPPSFPYPDEGTAVLAYQNRVKKAYNDVGRIFPDPNDSDAYRHFVRYGYSCHEMKEPDAQNKHVKELRAQLGAPPE